MTPASLTAPMYATVTMQTLYYYTYTMHCYFRHTKLK